MRDILNFLRCPPLIIWRLSKFIAFFKVPFIPSLLDRVNLIVFSVWIPHSVVIGKRFMLGYWGLGVVIHGECVIGDDVLISQGVTLGGNSRSEGVPVIGDSVYIGAGAKILGPITIGRNVLVGANSVVLRSFGPNVTVAGVPARVVREVTGVD